MEIKKDYLAPSSFKLFNPWSSLSDISDFLTFKLYALRHTVSIFKQPYHFCVILQAVNQEPLKIIRYIEKPLSRSNIDKK